ncbi:MAG: methyltransferase domain-containing protein [Chloroflexi bacterium]|nr:methyltransferase domain-containing protein [Chloroflexota bacterium]
MKSRSPQDMDLYQDRFQAYEAAGVLLASPEMQPEDWEWAWAPYSEADYRAVLGLLHHQDVVLDIGAGDLRFAFAAAKIVRRVYAIEIQDALLRQALRRYPTPENLIIIHADARRVDFPEGVSVGVLMMRHCSYFRLYAEKLRRAGARRLITNARWRMGLEEIDLNQPRIYYPAAQPGWYACWGGRVGFKAGDLPGEAREDCVQEVIYCPDCSG